jgi:hypothetical protein
MNAVVKTEQATLAETNTVSMFERLARDPSVDVEKLQRLMDLQERAFKRDAEAAFNADLAQLQAKLPTIQERGSIKDRAGGVQSRYALWEDVNRVILPLLRDHGFSLTFRQEQTQAGICVTGVLSHRLGHSERTSITLPADTSGSKNAVQAVGSSVSYGKRYTAGMLLNLTSGDLEPDDDAQSAGSSELRLSVIEKLKESQSLQAMREAYKALSKAERAAVTQGDLDAIKAGLQ